MVRIPMYYGNSELTIYPQCVCVLLLLLLFSSLSHTFFRVCVFYSVSFCSLYCLFHNTLILDLFELLDSKQIPSNLYINISYVCACVRAYFYLCIRAFFYVHSFREYWFRISSHSVYICMSVYLLCICFFLHCLTFVTRYVLHDGAASVAVYFYGHSRITNEPKQRGKKKLKKIHHKTNSIYRDFRTPHSHSSVHRHTHTHTCTHA